MKCFDLSGLWNCEIPGQNARMRLPGTLDESGIGFPDDPEKQWKVDEVQRIGFWQKGDPIVTRLTRKYTYEGAAELSRTVEWEIPQGKRLFVDVERARFLQLYVNGQKALLYRPASVTTPYTYEVTGMMTGHDRLRFVSDNSYPGWPRESIVYASAASDETQTNWNGLLGSVRIRTENSAFISDLRVYPYGNTLRIAVEIDAASSWQGVLSFKSEALSRLVEKPVDMPAGRQEFCYDLSLAEDSRRWDMGEGNLYDLTVSAEGMDMYTTRFGIRDFRAEAGHLTLNGRRVFLRSEANCAVFPETGYCPMDVDTWKEILRKYGSYGVNCMRFHSHCPPEAAFMAADELGMLMQPELSHWDPRHAFESEEAQAYYRNELLQILRQLACHPSFVMLTFGNELCAGKAGHAFMDELLDAAREYDPTRLYANGSNTHYGELGMDPKSDFYTAMRFHEHDMRATCDSMRGWLNNEYPNSRRDYSKAMGAIRAGSDKPVFSFEVGQYEVLPDFDEIESYHGVTEPANLRHIRQKVREKGFAGDWKRMVEATGESSLLCYRAEVESAMRTDGYSGISLLGLQDFPGQGTALVGMMNAHLQHKPYGFAKPERFAAFFRDVLPLVLLERYTYTTGNTMDFCLRIANYGKQDLSGKAQWRLRGSGFDRCGEIRDITAQAGSLTEPMKVSVLLEGITKPSKLTLTLVYCGHENTYPVWVYPDEKSVCPDNVYECRTLDEKAVRTLQEGGDVYLSPDSTPQALPHSIKAQFSPDFWSVCTFPQQEGGMGQLIDTDHPIFQSFPTESYNNWQWWPMANQRAMILPERIRCIVTEMDSYAFLRPMAKLFECRCEQGRLMVSSLNLHNLRQFPEARALQKAIYDYMASPGFAPEQKLSLSWIRTLFQKTQ